MTESQLRIEGKSFLLLAQPSDTPELLDGLDRPRGGIPPLAFGGVDAGAVVTGIAYGPVLLDVQPIPGSPGEPDEEWEEVEEIDVEITTDVLHIVTAPLLATHEAFGNLATRGFGIYRIRVHATGRHIAPDRTRHDSARTLSASGVADRAPTTPRRAAQQTVVSVGRRQ